jgi:hypothetical protein
MTLPNCTAFGTPFGRMPTIDYIKRDAIVKTTRKENLPNFEEGDSHYSFVEFSAFGFESSKFLNSNVSIESDSKVHNLLDHLTYIGLNEVIFTMPQSPQSVEVLIGLHDTSAPHYLLAFNPDVLAKIRLVKNFASVRNHTDSYELCIDVNSEHIFSWLDGLFFAQISNNLKIWGQPISLASPPIIQKGLISLPIAVLDNRNSDCISWVNTQFYKRHRHSKYFTVSGNIKFDSNTFGDAFAFPDRALETTNNLHIKRGNGFGS